MIETIKLAQLAALADCIEGVNLGRVWQYRQAIRSGAKNGARFF